MSGGIVPIACGPRAVESDTLGEISGLADEEICYGVVGKDASGRYTACLVRVIWACGEVSMNALRWFLYMLNIIG